MQRKPLSQGDEDGFCGLYSITNAISLLFPHAMNDDGRTAVFKVLCKALPHKRWPAVVWDGTTVLEVGLMLDAARDFMAKRKYLFRWSMPFGRRKFSAFNEFETELRMHIKGDDAFAIVGISKPWSHWTCAHYVMPKTLIMTDSCHLKKLPLAKCGLTGHEGDYLFDSRQTFVLNKV